MRVVLVVMAIAILPAGLLAAQDAKMVEKGQQVYTAQKCSVCHSVADKGMKKGPLDDVGSKLSADEIREWLVHPDVMAAKAKATRKPPMKAYDKLPKDDLDALVAYLSSLKK